MLGPKQQQLKAYIENANEDSLDSAGDQWRQGEQILRQLATDPEPRGRHRRRRPVHRRHGHQDRPGLPPLLAEDAGPRRPDAGRLARLPPGRDRSPQRADPEQPVRQARRRPAADQARGQRRREGPERVPDAAHPVLEPVRRPRDRGRRGDRGAHQEPHRAGRGLPAHPRRGAAPAARRRWWPEPGHLRDGAHAHPRARWRSGPGPW